MNLESGICASAIKSRDHTLQADYLGARIAENIPALIRYQCSCQIASVQLDSLALFEWASLDPLCCRGCNHFLVFMIMFFLDTMLRFNLLWLDIGLPLDATLRFGLL